MSDQEEEKVYKVLKINDYVATRTIELLNEKTGTIDECFDYSGLTSDDVNFEFMEKDMSYNCKIQLFGKQVKENTAKSVQCKIMNQVKIGIRTLVQVLIGGDEYYISQKDIGTIVKEGLIFFEYTRKDLIQVDDVVHINLLQEL